MVIALSLWDLDTLRGPRHSIVTKATKATLHCLHWPFTPLSALYNEAQEGY